MRRMSGLVFENEEVNEARGVVFLLPRQVHLSTRLVFANMRNKFLNSLLDVVNTGRFDLIFGDRVNGHGGSSSNVDKSTIDISTSYRRQRYLLDDQLFRASPIV